MMPAKQSKLLLVDDHEANLVALRTLLSQDGVEVLQAGSGREALEMLLDHDVALAIIDVHMPIMDGFASVSKSWLQRTVPSLVS